MKMSTMNTDSILEVFGTCLRDGIANQELAGYWTETKSVVLFVQPQDHIVEILSYGISVVSLYFDNDNIRWDSVTIGDHYGNKNYDSVASKCKAVYEKARGEKGYAVQKKKRPEFGVS